MNNIPENLLTAEEVSGILRIPLPTIYRLTQQSKIKAVKIGKHWRYRKEDIERYFEFGTDFSMEPERKPFSSEIASPRHYVVGTRNDEQGKGLLRTFGARNDGSADFNERRAYPRINASFKCNYSINLPPFKIINSSGIIKNMSTGGIFLVNQDEKIEINDPIDLNFMIEDTEINAKGKVVRKTEDGMGIKFKSIDKKMRDRIMEYTV